MCTIHIKGRGCWTGPGKGLGAEAGGWGVLGGLEAGGWVLGGWGTRGAGAGPSWLIENAFKAATFQKQKKSRKEAEKKQEL